MLHLTINAQSVSIALPAAAGLPPLDLSGIDTLVDGLAFASGAPAAPVALRMPGTEWPEEGGVVAGIMPAQGEHPAYYLIVPTNKAAEASKELTWGHYGTTVEGLSDCDGMANTALLAGRGGHPAADFCYSLDIEGKRDWYLMSRREASLAAATVPHLFTKGYHWSSTQYSANGAFVQDFSDGTQGYLSKDHEWRVRAVRRVVIN